MGGVGRLPPLFAFSGGGLFGKTPASPVRQSQGQRDKEFSGSYGKIITHTPPTCTWVPGVPSQSQFCDSWDQ